MNGTRVTPGGPPIAGSEPDPAHGPAPRRAGEGTPEAAGPRRGGRRRRPAEPEFTSYYGLPVLKKPTWESRDIAGYLFLGGLAGASSVVGAAAHLTGRPHLARATKAGAAGGIALSFVALVHDLGRPARFVNMLRVVKVTSPMNVGSWLLSIFGPAATVAAASDLTGLAPGLGTAATVGAAAVGPAVAAYTAALVCDTAVPSWHEGHRHMPFVFVSSAASAAAGLGLMSAPIAETGPVRRLAVAAGLAELVSSRVMEQRMGMAGEPHRLGRAGRYHRAAEVLTLAGALGAAAFGRRNRLAAALAGAALLAGSAATRFGIFHAGVQSTEDPRYTVVPQRARQDGRPG